MGLRRTPEPEVMDDRSEVEAYRDADFSQVNGIFARRALRVAGRRRRRVVDLGTGPAEIPVLLCRLAPGLKVVAVDASREMLREARARVRREGLEGRIVLLRSDAKRVRALRGPFDLVVSNSLLHHLEDPVPFFREAARLAGRSGRLCIQDLSRPSSRAAARRLVRKHAGDDSPLLRELFHRSLLAAYTPAEVRGLLRRAGLRGVRVRMVSDRHLVVSGRPLGASRGR